MLTLRAQKTARFLAAHAVLRIVHRTRALPRGSTPSETERVPPENFALNAHLQAQDRDTSQASRVPACARIAQDGACGRTRRVRAFATRLRIYRLMVQPESGCGGTARPRPPRRSSGWTRTSYAGMKPVPFVANPQAGAASRSRGAHELSTICCGDEAGTAPASFSIQHLGLHRGLSEFRRDTRRHGLRCGSGQRQASGLRQGAS